MNNLTYFNYLYICTNTVFRKYFHRMAFSRAFVGRFFLLLDVILDSDWLTTRVLEFD